MEVSHIYNETQERLEIKLEFDRYDLLALKDNLCDIQGIIDWYSNGPSREKIANCKSRLLNKGIDLLRKDPEITSIPTQEQALLDLICSHPSYQTQARHEWY